MFVISDGDAYIKINFDEPQDLLSITFTIRWATNVTVTLIDESGEVLDEFFVSSLTTIFKSIIIITIIHKSMAMWRSWLTLQSG